MVTVLILTCFQQGWTLWTVPRSPTHAASPLHHVQWILPLHLLKQYHLMQCCLEIRYLSLIFLPTEQITLNFLSVVETSLNYYLKMNYMFTGRNN